MDLNTTSPYNVTKIYKDTLSTANQANILLGIPTRVNSIGPGLDPNN